MTTSHIKILVSCFILGIISFPALSVAHEHCSEKEKKSSTCEKKCAELPENMASWNAPISIQSAQNESELAHTKMSINQTVLAKLYPARSVKFIIPTEERGGSVSFAGMVHFNVPTKATYRIITNGRPWVEMVQNDQKVESSKHQHGSECLGTEKILEFPLEAGQHTIEFAANGKETIKFIIIPTTE